MKKLIISTICLLALAAGVSSYAYYRSHVIAAKNALAQANVEALTECEESIKKEGSIIVVTVCNRKTPLLFPNMPCSIESDSECSFTNVSSK